MTVSDVASGLRRPGLLAAAFALALAGGGCGGLKRGENANLVAGKQAFVAKCGSCHVLGRASTKGNIGPNLDDAFQQSLVNGLKRDTIRTVVHGQVLNPNPGGAMPRNLVHGRAVDDIAAYVAQSVDRGGPDTGLLASAVAAPGAGKPAVESGGRLAIDADPSGQLAYVTKQASAKTGAVTVTMKNMAPIPHNIAIQQGASGSVLGASPIVQGATASVKVNLAPGTYTYFCQVPGHRQAGMLGTITVK